MGDSQHSQNTQINKVVGENENVFYFTEKINRLFGQPNITIEYEIRKVLFKRLDLNTNFHSNLYCFFTSHTSQYLTVHYGKNKTQVPG